MSSVIINSSSAIEHMQVLDTGIKDSNLKLTDDRDDIKSDNDNIIIEKETKREIALKKLDSKFFKEKQKADYFKIFTIFVQSSNGFKKAVSSFLYGCKWILNYENALNLSRSSLKKTSDLKAHLNDSLKKLYVCNISNSIANLKKVFCIFSKENISKNSSFLIKNIFQLILDLSMYLLIGEVIGLYKLTAYVKSSVLIFKRLCLLVGIIFIFNKDKKDYMEMQYFKSFAGDTNELSKREITIFKEVKNLSLIKLFKSTILIALSAFLLIEGAFGLVLLAETIKLSLTTISFIAGIFAYFYQESMSYPLVP